MLVDLDGLESAARRLAAGAAAVDRQADRLAACARGTTWAGPAADAFRAALAADVARLRASADGLDEAARARRAHACSVQERVAQLAAAAARARETAEDALDELGDAAEGLLRRLP